MIKHQIVITTDDTKQTYVLPLEDNDENLQLWKVRVSLYRINPFGRPDDREWVHHDLYVERQTLVNGRLIGKSNSDAEAPPSEASFEDQLVALLSQLGVSFQ